jgi:Zn-dependent protease
VKNLVVLAAVFAILRLAAPLLFLHRVLRLRFWRPSVRLATDDEVPSRVREGLKQAVEELQRLGFQQLGWLAQELEGFRDDVPRYQARLFHPDACAYAALGYSSAPDQVAPWSVRFWTFGVGDRSIHTHDWLDRSLLGEPPGTTAAVSFAATIEEQWEAHRVAAIDLVPANLDHDAVLALSRDRDRAQIDSAVRNGGVLPAGGQAYMLSWRLALRVSRQVRSGAAEHRAQRRRRESVQRVSQRPLPQIPFEEESAAYQRILDASSGPPRTSFLAALFVVTLAIFVIAEWYATGTATTAALVLVVLLFHELGHYLAMRAFGYVDTSIFFIPFLGGVAVGRNDRATLGQRMIVLFAGPLPGLLVAIAVAIVHPPSSPLVREAVLILVSVNLFNLLPILPLDGGQIAHMLLFVRHPWLDVASRAVAGVGLILLAWKLSATFLGVLGAFMLFQLPGALKTSRLRRKLREARTVWPGETPVRAFFRVLPTTPFARESFMRKVVVARAALAQPTLDAPLRTRELLGALSVYVAVLGAGCVALLLSFTASAGTPSSAPQPLHVDAEATLGCPAPEIPETDPSATFGLLRGIAFFSSPEALVAAKGEVAAAFPESIVRSTGPVLFVWNPPEPGADEDDDSFEARSTEQAQRVQAVMIAAGARGYMPGKATPVIECAAPDDAAARSIGDALEAYVTMTRNSMEVPAPWSDASEPTPAEELARATFRIAVEARDAVRWKPSPPSLWAVVTLARRKNAEREFRAQQIRAVEAAMAAERTARPIDELVARLVVAKISAGPSDEAKRVDAQLRDRLGAASPRGRAGLSPASRASRTGSKVQIEFLYLEPYEVDRGLAPMLRWFCVRSCETRILLESR